MITDYTPGAYMTHDMLHMRGGHQVDWLIDGVEIPNTNIATNLGAQIDPKDIDYLEVQRGSYNADIGDRTYGVFNVVPRTGFERNREAELVLTAGNFFQTNDQLNFGDHTENFAYYASLNGNRSDYGLAPPIGQVLHDATNGYGGFASFIYNRTPKDQFRLVAQLRQDYFQIPYDPDPNELREPAVRLQRPARRPARDRRPLDLLLAPHLQRLHRPPGLALLPLQQGRLRLQPQRHARRHHRQPLLHLRRRAGLHHHRDRAQHAPGRPLLLRPARQLPLRRHLQRRQRQPQLLYARLRQRRRRRGVRLRQLQSHLLAHPHRRPAPVALPGRSSPKTQPTRASASPSASPNSTGSSAASTAASISRRRCSPRRGPVVQYRAAPTTPRLSPCTANATKSTSSACRFPSAAGCSTPTPSRPASTTSSTTPTSATPASTSPSPSTAPSSAPGSSPCARRGSGTSARRTSPTPTRSPSSAATSPAASSARPIGDPACDAGFDYTPVDHDQRNTLNVGFNATLPWQAYASTNVYYGSGFTNGSPDPTTPYPNAYLPQHTTVDLSLGKTFGEQFSALHHRHQRRQQPHAARQQPHLRRLPLQRSPPDLCRGPLPLQVLTRLLRRPAMEHLFSDRMHVDQAPGRGVDIALRLPGMVHDHRRPRVES